MEDVKLVRIKMLRNRHGSPDGYTVKHYDVDTEYDVPEALAKTFTEEGVAERLTGSTEEAADATPIVDGEDLTDDEKAERPLKNKVLKALKNKDA